MKRKKLKFSVKHYVPVIIVAAIIILLVVLYLFRAKPDEVAPQKNLSFFTHRDTLWADSVLNGMSNEEKAAQLLIIPASPDELLNENSGFFRQISPGGFFLNSGLVSNIAASTRKTRQHFKIPPIFAVDAPFGLYSPNDSISSVLKYDGISCINNDLLLDELAKLLAKQMKHNGLTMNTAVSLEMMGINRDLPWDESFVRFVYALRKNCMTIANALQQERLLACVRGFAEPWDAGIPSPAFGVRLDSLRKMPLNSLVMAGLAAIIPPESENRKWADSLRNTYHFNGLLIAMPQINHGDNEDYIARLSGGYDMIILNEYDADKTTKLIKEISSHKILREQIHEKARKILLIKSWTGAGQKTAASPDSAAFYCCGWKSKLLYRKIVENSVVLLGNKQKLIPFKEIQKESFALLQIGNRGGNSFANNISHYVNVKVFDAGKNTHEEVLAKQLGTFSKIIVSISQSEFTEHNDQVQRIKSLIDKISVKDNRCAVVVFGNTAFLSLFGRFPVMMWSCQNTSFASAVCAQMLFGAERITGTLPYCLNNEYCFNDGVVLNRPCRLKYSSCEDAGINENVIDKVDSVISHAIGAGAFPGCQVFCARNGKVFLNKAYGRHVYSKSDRVKPGDLYDLASVTKIAATTLAIMALYDRGMIRLDSTLNYYFDDLDKNASGKKVRNSKLNYISLRELLTHRSGLPEGLPVGLFINPLKALEMIRIEQEKQALADSLDADEEANVYEVIDTNLLKASSDSLLKYIYGKEKDKTYSIEIAENMWMRANIADSLWQLAKQSWMRKGKKYLYSDLNMYLAMKVAEKVSGKKLDEFLREMFFMPMNLSHICFYPRKYNKKENIVPTEDEQYFRKQLIQGYVHDPLAAIAGGNGGNAGLFSNAGDLGVLMQMLLNGGSYGGRQYLKEGTVQLFVKAQDGGWRGLGFDRKGGTESKMVAGGASPKTYGHTGFSGTCVWVDPEYNIVFVFLSNRIHPKSSNQKINSLRVRQNVQQLIYEAVIF